MTDPDAVADSAALTISDALHRLIRSANRRKAQLAADGEEQEWAAHALLEQIVASGPMRAASLAECTFTDPSTISRHVASLVRDGLIERRADPIDGRASLLVTTTRGEALVSKHRELRRQWLQDMLGRWTDEDLVRFGDLLMNFVAHFEAGNVEPKETAHHTPALAPVSEGTR